MSNRHHTSMARICVLLLLLIAVLPVYADDKAADAERQKLKKLGQQIQSLQVDIKAASKNVQTLEEELEAHEKEITETTRKIDQSQKAIGEKSSELEKLNAEKILLERQRDAQQQAIIKQINLSYRLGNEPALKLILNQQDTTEISRLIRYHGYFLQARASRMNEYLATLTSLAEHETGIREAIAVLESNRQQLKAQLEQLGIVKKARQETLDTMTASLNADHAALQQMQIERKRLEAVIERLSQEIGNITLPPTFTIFSKQQGKLEWPVEGNLKYRFGQKRNSAVNWNGWFLSAREGAPVKSIHNGRVVFADYLRGHGLLIVIDHGEGYMSLYAHNQILLAEAGDWVTSGTTIARAGQTGGQKLSGLYFEIRRNGKPTNPGGWLKPR